MYLPPNFLTFYLIWIIPSLYCSASKDVWQLWETSVQWPFLKCDPHGHKLHEWKRPFKLFVKKATRQLYCIKLECSQFIPPFYICFVTFLSEYMCAYMFVVFFTSCGVFPYFIDTIILWFVSLVKLLYDYCKMYIFIFHFDGTNGL